MRWLIVATTFLLSVLLYVDRTCISVAKDNVSSDLGLSNEHMGWVFSAFALGYALLQTPGGWLADRLGPRFVLTLIVSAWSIFTGLTAAASNFVFMLVVRFLFGAAEAGAFPGMSRAVFSWIPMSERGRVQAINFSGSRIGAAVTLPMLAWLIASYGWRATFVVLMLTGFVWSAIWYLMFRNDPREATWLSSEELDHILATRQPSAAAKQSSSSSLSQEFAESPVLQFSQIMASPRMWPICTQYFASNFVFFFALTWFFPQLKSRYDLSGIQASLFAAGPLCAGAVGCWISGVLVDRLYSRGNWLGSRRIPAMLGFLLAAIGIIGSAHASTALISSIWFSLCIFGADMTLPPSWSTCVDIGRDQSGVVSGMMNMAGNLGSFVTSLAFPYMLAWTGSSLSYFYIAALLNLVAIGLWSLIDPRMPLNQLTNTEALAK